MDQLFQNPWLIGGLVVGVLVLAIGITVYMRWRTSPSTAQMNEVQQPLYAADEDESVDQGSDGNKAPEGEEPPAPAAPSQN